MASSVQFSEARLSMARHRSTVAMGRDDFSLTARIWSLTSGFFDQDVDLWEADLYRDFDPPGAVGDGELAIFSVTAAAAGCRRL